jgi:hypothetical protein
MKVPVLPVCSSTEEVIGYDFECAVSAGKSAQHNLPSHVPEKVLAGVPARLFRDIVRALGP